MIYFIVGVRTHSDSGESEITHYKYYSSLSLQHYIIAKQEFYELSNGNSNDFYSHNLHLNTKVVCKWFVKNDSNGNQVPGTEFLKSDPDGTQKNNLINLPRI